MADKVVVQQQREQQQREQDAESLAAVAQAEREIALEAGKLVELAEQIHAAAAANSLDVEEIAAGTEQLEMVKKLWIEQATDHQAAAAAAADLASAHGGRVGEDWGWVAGE